MGWKSDKWKGPTTPFENLPESGRPIKKIYVSDDGKLVIVYDDLKEEEEEV